MNENITFSTNFALTADPADCSDSTTSEPLSRLVEMEISNRSLSKLIEEISSSNRKLQEELRSRLHTRRQIRILVDLMIETGLSERRACELVGIPRSTQRYKRRRLDEEVLKHLLIGLANQQPHLGYRKLTALLKDKGMTVNHKVVYRLYKQANLGKRIKLSKGSQ